MVFDASDTETEAEYDFDEEHQRPGDNNEWRAGELTLESLPAVAAKAANGAASQRLATSGFSSPTGGCEVHLATVHRGGDARQWAAKY